MWQSPQGDIGHYREAVLAGGRPAALSPSGLAYAILDEVVDSDFRVLDHVQDRIEEVDEAVWARPDDADLTEASRCAAIWHASDGSSPTCERCSPAALEGHMSVVSDRLNAVVLWVSAWAAIIAAPTVIASFYGMNLRDMPELRWELGYPFALALMPTCAVGLHLVFKRRRWL